MVKTKKLLVLTLMVELGLSACGGGTEPSQGYNSVSALAKALGCRGVASVKRVPGVKEQGGCQLDGERLMIYIWPDGIDSKELGGSSPFGGGWIVLGKNWTVAAMTAAGAKKTQDKLGGQLK